VTKNKAGQILVPIDLHQIRRENLETLIAIARQIQRGVLGLLLEDLRLQQIADLPFTTEITLSGARERSLIRGHLSRRHLRATASTRQLLSELAEKQAVELNFEETSGHRLRCALERDGGVDIFFPPRHQWQRELSGAPRNRAPLRKLGMLLPSYPQGQRALHIGIALLQAGLVEEIHALAGPQFNSEALGSLPLKGRRLFIQRDVSIDREGVLRLIRRSPYDLLLLPRVALDGIPHPDLDAALEVASGQVLVLSAEN